MRCARSSQRNDRPQEQSTRAQMGIQGLPREFCSKEAEPRSRSAPRRGRGDSGWRRSLYGEGAGSQPNPSGPDRVTSRAGHKAQSVSGRDAASTSVVRSRFVVGTGDLDASLVDVVSPEWAS